MKRLFLIIIFIIVLSTNVSGYETNVHEEITKKAIVLSNIENYLGSNLNIKLNAMFNNEKINRWLELGSRWEDDDLTMRWLNHFYDPTTEQGLGIGVPSLEWGNSYSSNSYSWSSARQYFYNALTGISLDTRETNFADLFRSLGQIVHLIQDKAVPAHVRNDPHFPYFDIILHDKDMYEEYTKNNAGLLTYNGYSSVYSTSDNITFNAFGAFWKNSGKGLAEFTNSNFFSRDTNIDNPPQYLNPTVLLGNQEFQEEITNADGDKEIVTVRYGLSTIIDNYTGSYDENVPITAYSLWDFDYKQKMGSEVYSLTDTVHQTYAGFLIPRAVGYSAGLLNCFFRGNIDFVADINTPGSYVIKNLGTEEITGTFALYYDAVDGNRYPVSGASWNNVKIGAGAQSVPLAFTLPTNPVPKTPGEYFLAFNGKMGQEEPAGGSIGAVAGKYISCTQKTDISDYQVPLFSGNSSYESLPYAWITHSDNGTYTLNGYIWILKNPIPSPVLRCFPIPIFGCYWYIYYPASPYANTYAPSDDRYTPELSSPEEFVKVWIDFNGDKTFAENEMVYEGQFSPFVADWYTNQLITVEQPLNISAKGYCQTVMRVALRWGAPPSGPYDTWDYGDVQDFQIDLK